MRRCALCRADTDGARPIRGAASEPAPLRGPCGPREPASRTRRRALPWLRPDREGGARPAPPSQGDGRPVEVAPRSAAPGKASDPQGRGAVAIAECPTHDPALRRRRKALTAEPGPRASSLSAGTTRPISLRRGTQLPQSEFIFRESPEEG